MSTVDCPSCEAELRSVSKDPFCHTCGARVSELGRAPTERAPARRNDPRLEDEIRRTIVGVLELHGFVVLDFEQGYRADGTTRVRKGLADLYVMGFGASAWIEVKSATGRQRPEQKDFEADCERGGVPYMLWRHEDEAKRWAEATRAAAA